jgi:hypothetical protein
MYLIEPMCEMLGYSRMDDKDMLTEVTAGWGQKNDKADLGLIVKGKKPEIIIECKKHGKKLTDKEYSKLKPAEQELCSAFEVGGETYYFMPGKLAKNYINRHNGDEIPVKEFFSARLFTDPVLKELDENIIKPTFKFPETQDEIDSLENEELENLNETDETSF